ncbi:hypothetical protein Patl1_28839 [Pistacia atlantica]|uniref:Uncharacterized protein n=1 Tax=Pistacia atlantica TaxID=434234 RepID=A0ACC1BDT2_9ROSI|nr:hypothetical protein Patl1_28839 [Pistacia atlantica]
MGFGEKMIAKLAIVSGGSFPDKRGVEEDSLSSSQEASNRTKLPLEISSDAASKCLILDVFWEQETGQLMDSSKTKKKQLPNTEVQNCLKQEILQLEKRLQDQFQVRRALEQALGYRTSSHGDIDKMSMPKPATELIKEIAVLELEVVYLEQYLLSLYRKAFDQQIPSVSPTTKDERLKRPLATPRPRFMEDSEPAITSKRETPAIQSGCQLVDNQWKESTVIEEEEDRLLDSGVHRCHSSLSQRSALPSRSSPPAESLGRAVRACHSQPLSMMEYAQNAPNIISLAEHLGTRISDHVPETPNKLSEDMIKCMSAIYSKLADPPVTHNGLSSPNSSLSSMSAFSPQDQCDMWSPGFRNNSTFDARLDNPFHVEGLQEFSGPYSTMIEIPLIYRDSQKLGDVEHLLQNFRLLISRLEAVDPRKLKHEEKLAFWINIHNALMMHAYLAYGIPQNNVKRLFLLLKAAYNIGGHTVSADTIQTSILGCRMCRPGQVKCIIPSPASLQITPRRKRGKETHESVFNSSGQNKAVVILAVPICLANHIQLHWIRLLLLSRGKFKTGDERQAYAIEHPEPLLHFALSSGNHSDPAVRVYTPKRVYQELEAAKEEFIRATFGVRKDHKILLPKVVESYAKDSSLCPAGIMEMVQQSLPESLRKSIKKCQASKSRKSIEWIPHNFTFRYLISKELLR